MKQDAVMNVLMGNVSNSISPTLRTVREGIYNEQFNLGFSPLAKNNWSVPYELLKTFKTKNTGIPSYRSDEIYDQIRTPKSNSDEALLDETESKLNEELRKAFDLAGVAWDRQGVIVENMKTDIDSELSPLNKSHSLGKKKVYIDKFTNQAEDIWKNGKSDSRYPHFFDYWKKRISEIVSEFYDAESNDEPEVKVINNEIVTRKPSQNKPVIESEDDQFSKKTNNELTVRSILPPDH